MIQPKKDIYGLIGKEIAHSFSPKYFSKKFLKENINAEYRLFPLKKIDDFNYLLQKNTSIKGLNVTIPYKEEIISFLDEIDETAKKINAVNAIKFQNKKLIGYNTDIVGFEKSFKPLLKKHHKKALVFGTGGASKAILYVLNKLEIDFEIVSRTKGKLRYSDINKDILSEYNVLINTTPLGMFPNVSSKVNMDYKAINKNHLVYDLVYNPLETAFLSEAKNQGAIIKNGLEMLEIQAEEAWKIWN